MRRIGIGVLIGLAAWMVQPAEAGLWRDIYTGLGYLATPSGYPLFDAGDGTRVHGARSGRLRILPNLAGRGHTIEFDRAFGADTRGRPEVLDLGMYELELRGSTQATLGYTSRGMLIASGTMTATDMNYSLRGKTGAQDFELRGVLNALSRIEVNPLGFYEITLNVGNTNAELRLDGVLVDDSAETNFNIGPINIDGNIYVDAVMAALGFFGVDTTPLQELFPGSPVDRILEPIQQTLQSAGLVAGFQLDAAGQLSPTMDFSTLTAESLGAGQATAGGQMTADAVPEPATLLLIAGGATVLWSGRRR